MRRSREEAQMLRNVYHRTLALAASPINSACRFRAASIRLLFCCFASERITTSRSALAKVYSTRCKIEGGEKRAGAGEGNRTLVFSLEGCCSTIELHPRAADQLSRQAGGLNRPALNWRWRRALFHW